MGTPELGDRLVWGKCGMPARLWVGFSAVSPQFPPCMKPAACGCACANFSPGCCFCLCPSSFSSSSLLCLVFQGPAVACKALDLHQPSCVEELLGTDLVTSLAVLSGSSSDPSLPLGGPYRGLQWIWDVGTGQRAPWPPVPSSAVPVPVPVTPVSLFPLFPLYACAC